MYINYGYIRQIPTYLHYSVYNLFEMTKIKMLINSNIVVSNLKNKHYEIVIYNIICYASTARKIAISVYS